MEEMVKKKKKKKRRKKEWTDTQGTVTVDKSSLRILLSLDLCTVPPVCEKERD